MAGSNAGLRPVRGKIPVPIYLFLLFLYVSILPAEEVCKYSYKGQPAGLNGTTLVLPDFVVAMSEYVPAGKLDSIYEQSDTLMYQVIPKDIIINGISPVSGWDGNGFTFPKLFTLTGDSTKFSYGIEYHVSIDSITENGDTITISDYDTVHTIEYTVELQYNVLVPDSVELTCWDRKIEFYYTGSPITEINSNMDALEIRFTEISVDTSFVYDSVAITLTNAAGIQKDKETYKLSDNGSYFSYTFQRAIDSIPTVGDGVLQHQVEDNFVATFKNPDLPLDTLRVSIPYIHTSAISAKNTFSVKPDLRIIRTGSGQHILRFSNLPDAGIVTLYLLNGKKILEQSIIQGNASLFLPKALPQAVYLMRLEYGEFVVSGKILLQ